MTAAFVIEPLAANHDRLTFSCGSEPLDRYLQTQAGQDVRRRIANCFIAADPNTLRVAGFYTLSATSIPLTDLPAEEVKRLPRYAIIPAVLIGRLAVDRHYAGQSLGSALLFDAISRTMRANPASFALLADAKDSSAVGFYRHFGFIPLEKKPPSLFLPIATAVKLRGRKS